MFLFWRLKLPVTAAKQINFKDIPFISTKLSFYRESEAQTDPFSPEYVVDKDNVNLEVLQIKDLFYGKGLPASMAEMELIE